MAFRKAVHRLTAPTEQLDREALSDFCKDRGFTPIASIEPRRRVATGGEVRSVRIVPRAGAPALEVTFSDGGASATAVFLGRRKIAGLAPGRKLAVEGMVASVGRQLVLYNPDYTFIG
ncbi:MAG: OB-fold nucleic acid binding domain-containing protein [Actinomycetota bacterium]